MFESQNVKSKIWRPMWAKDETLYFNLKVVLQAIVLPTCSELRAGLSGFTFFWVASLTHSNTPLIPSNAPWQYFLSLEGAILTLLRLHFALWPSQLAGWQRPLQGFSWANLISLHFAWFSYFLHINIFPQCSLLN